MGGGGGGHGNPRTPLASPLFLLLLLLLFKIVKYYLLFWYLNKIYFLLLFIIIISSSSSSSSRSSSSIISIILKKQWAKESVIPRENEADHGLLVIFKRLLERVLKKLGGKLSWIGKTERTGSVLERRICSIKHLRTYFLVFGFCNQKSLQDFINWNKQ